MRMKERRALWLDLRALENAKEIVSLLDDFHERHKEFAKMCNLTAKRFCGIFLRAARRRVNNV